MLQQIGELGHVLCERVSQHLLDVGSQRAGRVLIVFHCANRFSRNGDQPRAALVDERTGQIPLWRLYQTRLAATRPQKNKP